MAVERNPDRTKTSQFSVADPKELGRWAYVKEELPRGPLRRLVLVQVCLGEAVDRALVLEPAKIE